MSAAVGVAKVPGDGANLSMTDTISWPALKWEGEQRAYAEGWVAAVDYEGTYQEGLADNEQYAEGFVDGAARTANALSRKAVDGEVAELAQSISARLTAGVELAKKVWAIMHVHRCRKEMPGSSTDAQLLEELATGWAAYEAIAGSPYSENDRVPYGDEVPESEARAYWKGFYKGVEDGDKRAEEAGQELYAKGLAEGLVDGCKIGSGIDPQTDEPYEDPDRPETARVAAAFRLGRQMERQQWERRQARGELA